MRPFLVLTSILALGMWAGVCSADVTDVQFDSTTTANTSITEANTLSFSATVGSNSNRYLALGVSLAADTTTYQMPTVKRASWTVGTTVQSLGFRLGQSSVTGDVDTSRSEVWQVVAPTVGTGTVRITLDTRPVAGEVVSSLTTGSTPVTGESLGTGDGVQTSFSGTFANSPVVRNTVTITAGSVVATDNGSGVLVGSGVASGTITYDTGAWSITYGTPPADSTPISAAYHYGRWRFSGYLSDPGVDPLTVSFSATVGGVTKTAADNGSGYVTGDSGNIIGSIVYDTGLWSLSFRTPPDASTDITATYDHLNVAQMVAGVVSFHNVNQTNPSPAGSTNADSDDRATSGVSGRLRDGVFAVVATTGPAGTLTPRSYMTERWKQANGTGNTDAFGAGATAANTDDDSTTMRWDFSSSRKWAIAVIGIKPPSTPTEARFARARAYATDDGTLVTWRTAYEVRNLGFKVYREDEHGQRLPLTRSLVAGSALFAGPSTELTAGRSYTFWDRQAGDSLRPYWLEAVDLDGRSTWYGPFIPELSFDGAAVPELARAAGAAARGHASPLLTEIGRAAAPKATAVHAAGDGVRRSTGREGSSLGQWRTAAREAARILVDETGWFRVTRAQLAAAGYDPGPNATGIRLVNRGREQAIRVTGAADGIFDMDDAIEFYGTAIDTPASGVNVYWLTDGSRAGLRVARVSGDAAGGVPVATFPATVKAQDRSVYVAAVTNNGDRDNFYGPVIANEAVTQTLTIDALPSEGAAAPVTLGIALQGLTEADHEVAVSFNGHALEAMEFSGDGPSSRSYQIDPAWLQLGDNEVTLQALGGDADVSVTDWLSLTWQRPFTASGDRLEMVAPAGATIRATGFVSGDIRLFDVTDQHRPVEILGAVEQEADGSWSVEAVLPDGGGDRLLAAVADGLIGTPAGLEANVPSTWHAAGNGADMVIVAHAGLMAAAEDLAAYRSANGVATVAVDAADLYDEFSWGIKAPEAIRAFLRQAASTWQAPPRYLLLMGDASVDPRDYLGFGDRDLVPTAILATNLLKTANDDWFADLDGNGLADLAVGRLPAASLEEAQAMVAKIVGYEQASGSWAGEVSLIADAASEDFDFGEAVDALELLVPGDVAIDRIDLEGLDQATAHQLIVDAFNEGRLLVNYDGHGSQTVWASDEVFGNQDALSLGNGSKLPLVVAMNCLNGLFQDVYQDSLAEALMVNPDGGAIMVWASSALTDPSGQDLMNRDLYRALFSGDRPAIGDAVLAAKAEVTDQDTRNTWILFGDPSMKLSD